MAQYNATPPVVQSGYSVDLQTDVAGNLKTSPAPGSSQDVVVKPGTAGGLTSARVVSGVGGVIKATAGQLFSVTAYNVNAGVRYLHFYNKATAPTLSTDTPILTVPLLGASVRDIPIGAGLGGEFSAGIAWAYTTDDIAIPVTAGTTAELHFSAGFK